MLYPIAYNYLVQEVDRALIHVGYRPGLGRTLVDLHLDDRFYVMPISVDLHVQQHVLRDAGHADDLVTALGAAVRFEDTTTFGGVLRVFARTLLNRAGVADMGRGEPQADATMRHHVVPRVNRILSALESEQQIQRLVEYDSLLELMELTALQYLQCDGPQGIDAGDLRAIQALREAGVASTHAPIREIRQICGLQGWAKWVRGLHSGINCLSATCGLDIESFREMVQHAIDNGANGPLALGLQYENAVQEMGLALALSFFGDLGYKQFAKPDRHVIDALEAYEGTTFSAARAFSRVQWHASVAGVTPRCLDKVLFLAGSGNFYLTGFHFGPKFKQGFLDHLRDNSDGVRTALAPEAETRAPQRAAAVVARNTNADRPTAGMLVAEGLPPWLRRWNPARRISMTDFFASRVVYYPGSGTDGQPVEFFGSRHAAHCFVYVDYGIPIDHVRDELGENGHPFAGYRSAARQDLLEHDLTPNGWVRHIQPEGAPLQPLAPGRPYAFIEILERRPEFNSDHGPERLAVLFLCADGVAAYDALFCQVTATPPFAVVLQDHGFGGNWTSFGQGGALENLASIVGRWPRFLFVAANTIAWTGYEAVDGATLGGGGEHRFVRQLWRRSDHHVDVLWEPQLIAGPAGITSARDAFFTSIDDAPVATALTAQVVALCTEQQVTVHHTMTNGGDLRVRVNRRPPSRRTQNAITMVWRPQKGYFSCQVVASPEECVELGISAADVKPNAGALTSRLDVRPGEDNEAFLSIVSLSIERFREQ